MSEENLVIGKELPPEEAAAEELEVEFYEYDDVQIIVAACTALDSVEAINPMTAADNKRVARIKRKCISMIDFYIGELYDLTIDKDEANNKDE
jgi:hypothetical protein